MIQNVIRTYMDKYISYSKNNLNYNPITNHDETNELGRYVLNRPDTKEEFVNFFETLGPAEQYQMKLFVLLAMVGGHASIKVKDHEKRLFEVLLDMLSGIFPEEIKTEFRSNVAESNNGANKKFIKSHQKNISSEKFAKLCGVSHNTVLAKLRILNASVEFFRNKFNNNLLNKKHMAFCCWVMWHQENEINLTGTGSIQPRTKPNTYLIYLVAREIYGAIVTHKKMDWNHFKKCFESDSTAVLKKVKILIETFSLQKQMPSILPNCPWKK